MDQDEVAQMAKALHARLIEGKLSLVTAESCTGGLIAAAITEIPRASVTLERGYVTYSNEAKQNDIGVPADTLRRYGAVSEQTARAMAEGALEEAVAWVDSLGVVGEVQIGQRWNAQQPAGKTAGLDRVDSDCISICLVGDLDRAQPTPRQLEQLQHLVTALQDRLKISREHVWVVEAADLPAGCGKYFPREAFRARLLP